MRTRLLSLLPAAVLCLAMQAQEHHRGMTFNDEEYDQIPAQATLLTRDYTVLPRKYSLEQYCPTPKSQGAYGTCTSWASAYAARTIAEAVNNGWTDKETINREAFSPPFIYAQIKSPYDTKCQNGSAISQAMIKMKNQGAVKYRDFNVMCAERITDDLYQDATPYKIDNFTTLFYTSEQDPVRKIRTVKKAISQKRPVVIGMMVYDSFDTAKDVWNGIQDGKPGGHAMCVVGYDDDKAGGAFLIMNSWGTNWGNGGFIWVRYDDFCKNVKYAYDIYVRKQPTPQPAPQPTPAPVNKELASIDWLTPSTVVTQQTFIVKVGVKSKSEIKETAVYLNGVKQTSRGISAVVNDGYDHVIRQQLSLREGVNTIKVEITNAGGTAYYSRNVTYQAVVYNELSGKMRIQLATGEDMRPTLYKDGTLPYYKMAGSYISGTRYRIYLSNDNPAYVYVIGSDLTNSVGKVFPPNDKVSPALTYKSNNIALPDEKWYIEMDNTKGKDYVCVLYSAEALDIASIIERIRNASGTFTNKVQVALGSKMASSSEISYQQNAMSFTAKTPKTVLPLIVEIVHN